MLFQKKKHKCIDCGFLEPPYHPGEATPELRQSIKNKDKINGMDVAEYLNCNYFVCHRRALRDYIRQLAIILGDRDCKYFRPYKQGYSPAQHLQIQDDENRDKLNWYRNIVIAVIFTILGAALTLLITCDK